MIYSFNEGKGTYLGEGTHNFRTLKGDIHEHFKIIDVYVNI